MYKKILRHIFNTAYIAAIFLILSAPSSAQSIRASSLPSAKAFIPLHWVVDTHDSVVEHTTVAVLGGDLVVVWATCQKESLCAQAEAFLNGAPITFDSRLSYTYDSTERNAFIAFVTDTGQLEVFLPVDTYGTYDAVVEVIQ